MFSTLQTFLQKTLRTDVTYLRTNGFWLSSNHFVQIACGLILSVILANQLDKVAFGNYQFIMSASTFLGAFTLSGIVVALKRSVAAGNTGTLRYALRTKLIWSIGISVASAAIAIYYWTQGNSNLTLAFLLIGLLTPVGESFTLYKSYYVGLKRFKILSIFGLVRRPLVVLTIIVVMQFSTNPVLLAGAYLGVSAITAIGIYLFTILKDKLPYNKDLEMLRYSKHLTLIGIVGMLSNNLDKLLIFHFLGATALAVYALAVLPATHLLKMYSMIGGELMFPKFVQKDFVILRKTLPYKVGIMTLFTLLIASVYVLLAPLLFSILFPLYPEAVIYSQVAVLSLLFKPATTYGQVFAAHALKKYQYVINVSTAIVNILLLLLLVPLFHIWGAIFTLIGAHLFWATLVTFLFYRHKENGPA